MTVLVLAGVCGTVLALKLPGDNYPLATRYSCESVKPQTLISSFSTHFSTSVYISRFPDFGFSIFHLLGYFCGWAPLKNWSSRKVYV